MTQTPGGRILAELSGESQTDQDLATAYRKLFSSQRRRLAGERLHRARELGQIRTDIDVQSSSTSSGAPSTTDCSSPTNPSPTTSSSDS
ncbi:TetR-like C-terminal domain-containing protein [Streptomyces sp. NPDC054834]